MVLSSSDSVQQILKEQKEIQGQIETSVQRIERLRMQYRASTFNFEYLNHLIGHRATQDLRSASRSLRKLLKKLQKAEESMKAS